MEMAFHQGCGEKLTEVQKRTRIRSGLKLHEQRIGTFLAISLLLLLTSGGATLAQPPAAATSYNQVQVKVRTANALNATYIGTVYNSSGYMEATFQSRYPVFSFDLPSSTYFFAVTALQQSVIAMPSLRWVRKGRRSSGGPRHDIPALLLEQPGDRVRILVPAGIGIDEHHHRDTTNRQDTDLDSNYHHDLSERNGCERSLGFRVHRGRMVLVGERQQQAGALGADRQDR